MIKTIYIYNSVYYIKRDNADGTHGSMYMSPSRDHKHDIKYMEKQNGTV